MSSPRDRQDGTGQAGPMSDSRLSALTGWIAGWGELWGIPSLATRTRVEFSSRLRASLGRCLPNLGIIRLHAALVEADEAILIEALAHEAAHVAVFLLHGSEPRPHGPEWASLVRATGHEPHLRLPAVTMLESRGRPTAPALFEHRCPVCQAVRTSRRRVPRWHCRACVSAGLEGRMIIRRRDPA